MDFTILITFLYIETIKKWWLDSPLGADIKNIHILNRCFILMKPKHVATLKILKLALSHSNSRNKSTQNNRKDQEDNYQNN
ncbi:hypothetical protein FKM82_001608 [Ascaphus truei]